jgi:lysozyme
VEVVARSAEAAMRNIRLPLTALALSASAFIGLAVHEGYTDVAVIPTKGDRPTHGFGSTFDENGTPVRMGDRTNPVRAVRLAGLHLSKEEAKFRESLPGVTLTQAEYDLYVDWLYQYGSGAWLKSSMRKHLLAGSYYASCKSLLLYRNAGGFDCSTPFNRRCSGVWDRQLDRFARCHRAQ